MTDTIVVPINKTQMATLACVTWRTLGLDEETRKKYACMVARIMINDLFALMGDDWTIADLNYYRADLTGAIADLGFLRVAELITAKQSKEILQAVWDLPYLDVSDYIRESEILKEAEGDELLSIVKTVVKDNPKVVAQILEGKDKAIGFLVGQVMKAAKGKANPQQATEMLRAEMEVK